MKITKKEFVEAMVNNLTSFLGVTKRLYSKDELFCKIEHVFDPKIFIEKRSCVARSKDLVFSGDSHLSLNQVGNYEFHKYEYNKGVVYICNHKSYDNFDEEWHENAIYYLVSNN